MRPPPTRQPREDRGRRRLYRAGRVDRAFHGVAATRRDRRDWSILDLSRRHLLSAKMPVDLLRLPGLQPVATREENGALIITCHGPRLQPERCCEGSIWNANGEEKGKFNDFTMQKQPVWLEVKRQKWECSICGQTCTERVPITQDRRTRQYATDRFVEALALDATASTFAAASSQHGVHESFTRRAFDDYAKRELCGYTPIMPRVIGIDEKYIKGVPHFVIGDVTNRRLLDILPSNKIEAIRSFLEPLKDRSNVKVVCQDMYPGYRNIVPEFFPNAEIVIDKWHVLRAVNRGVTKARMYARKKVFHSMQIDLFEGESVSDQADKLAKELEGKVDNVGYLIRRAIYLQKEFYKIYRTKDGSAYADKLMSQFVLSLSPELRKVFSKLMRALKYNRKGILQYFDDPFTNAYIERLNGLIGALERNATGLRYDTLRAKALLSYGHLRADPQYQRMPGPSRPWRKPQCDPATIAFLSTTTGIDTDIEPDWGAIAPRGGADLEILTAVLETGTL